MTRAATERLSTLTGVAVPVVQAPMAGVSTPAMAGAVSAAGGLGSIAVGALSAAAAETAIRDALPRCAGRLNVNVFTHARPRRNPAREAAWLRTLTPWFEELGVPPPAAMNEIYRTLDDEPDMLDVLTALRPPVVSFHFGLPTAASIHALKSYGACLIATATSVAEARRLVASGIDVIVAQGFEAGGHRGAFGDVPDEGLSTFTLLPRVVEAVDVPVLAAGGISSGAGIAAAMAMGAAGVQMGTAFVECPESAAGQAYRRMLREEPRHTAMTRLFSGRPARGIVNRFVRELQHLAAAVPDYPAAYDAAKQLSAAAPAGSTDFAAMWAGQGPVRERPLAAGELVRALGDEMTAALAGLM